MLTFEVSLLPIIFIILGFGGQRSRLPATLYFLIYTLLFSLPMLMVLLTLKVNLNLLVNDYYVGGFTFLVLIICFLVKLPVFGLHY
jgi:NADH:ubiquinone oxidoreductase subunit 4 (subunit M)